MSNAVTTCPKCSRPVPATAAKGLCSVCLISSVFDVLSEPAEEAPEMPSPFAARERLTGYELLDQLGRGGMGIVFRARDTRLNRIVALKLLLTGKLASELEVKRFRTEAEAAARLSHPGIVPIYEVGEERGAPYFTMKLMEGGTLAAQLLDGSRAVKIVPGNRPAISGGLRGHTHSRTSSHPTRSAGLMATIARAVHFAHQHGILHRDLKPANILLDSAGEPFVSDFGLARRLESRSGPTVSGDLLGTPSYMAPEVATSGSRQATTASDIYSLGAILYELLSGRPPFEAESVAALLRKIVEEEPLPPGRTRPSSRFRLARTDGGGAATGQLSGELAVDRDLETICLKCLTKDPAGRYESALALAEDLERWLRGEPIHARPIGLGTQIVKWARRKPAWAVVSILMLVTPLVIIWLLVAGNARVRRAQGQTRLNLYAADMQVVQTALEDANLGLAQKILDSYVPIAGERDLRGFEWRYLAHQAQSGQLRALRAHSQAINCVQFSPDGNWLASSEAGRTVWFWSTTTWKPERVIDWSGPTSDEFRAIAFSADGKTISVAQDPGFVSLFDEKSLQAGWFVATLPKNGSQGPKALWSPGQSRLVFLARDPEGGPFTAVLDWEALQARPGAAGSGTNGIVFRRDKLPNVTVCPDPPLWRLAEMDTLHSFTAEGRLLAGRAGRLFELELRQGSKATPIPTAHTFDYCERSRDGRFLAGFNSSPKDRHSVLMDEFLPGTTNYWEIIGHEGDVRCLAISPDSRFILSGSADHTARVWDAHNRKTVAELRGHTDEVTAVAWSPDSKLIATGSKDHNVMLWNGQITNPPAEGIAAITGLVAPWLLAADGTALAARSLRSGVSNSVVVRNFSDSETVELQTSNALPVHIGIGGGELLTIEQRADRHEAELRSWNTAARTTTLLQTLVLPPAARAFTVGWSMSPDRGWIARTDENGLLCLWLTRGSNEPVFQVQASNQPIGQATFSPDSTLLAVLRTDHRGDCSLQFWSLRGTVESIGELTPPITVNSFAWSPDGLSLAFACADHTVQVWDARARVCRRTLTGHKRAVAAVAFSPDGRTIASGDGRTIKLWQTMTGREMITVYRDIKLGAPLRWLAFSADGRRLLAAEESGEVMEFLAASAIQ